jgi:PhnB protein
MGLRAPGSIGGTPVLLYAYVEDVDNVWEKALARGAKSLRDVEDRFYGDRAGQLEDPFGHRWDIATHVEDVAPDEMARRAAEVMGGAPSSA